jgi:hypothetical protein
MKRHVRVLTVVLVALGVVAILPVAGVMAQEETIQGIVTADGEIETADGDLYLVDSNALGTELKALVGKKVEATGTVLEGMYGGYSITVTAYKQM